jgi:hypothetical protein
MAKHKRLVKEIMETKFEPSRDLFNSKDDKLNMVGKLTIETHKSYANDTKSIPMWAVENT